MGSQSSLIFPGILRVMDDVKNDFLMGYQKNPFGNIYKLGLSMDKFNISF